MTHPAIKNLTPAFSGKVAFITGAAQGFGRNFAEAIVAAGGRAVICDIDLDAARATAAAIAAGNERAIAVRADVADEGTVDAAVADVVQQWGGIDILINNAGRHLTKYNQPFAKLSRTDIREMMDVNFMGVVNCTLACRDSMRARGGGVIINIASIAGYLSSTPYGVSKLAVRGLTIAFAGELAADNIRVNAIAPGLMGTEAALAELPEEFVTKFRDELQLVHRLGKMEDITATVLYLCSDAASFITGETLKVSGGYPLGI
ncbi:MAG: dehydrogenase, short-chain alcohol dehydrogenase like protein [Verrucomicrobiaceae bacterium]|nr:dehydrogenase, short-chain alcohol dehydrogenase like protein [Verrucomicrobiaceae bacterium]